ncbi:effector-associated constant component EACC1 [Planomonospora venezuelensis]|uniref:Uncharacterized protein n=1 Tax=Planomonospora venezuelensis TaxID=1999 RepID=A0A841DHU2_PLAVE|nr:hypothetical protein [Planomonospora venezuelensis]
MSVSTDDSDQLRSLSSWLEPEPELRGRVGAVERDPAPGTLGPVTEALQIALGSGGAVAALSGVVVAWLGSRPGDVTVKLVRGEDQIEVSAGRVRSLDAGKLVDLTAEIAKVLEDPDDR